MFGCLLTDQATISLLYISITGDKYAFARGGQQQGILRALERGKTKEEYLESEKKWAVAMAIVAIIFLVAATYYNLVIRPTLGA